MLHDVLTQQILLHLPHAATDDQRRAAEALARFLLSPHGEGVFLLRGYAGTGKTSLLAALVGALRELKRDVVLLAPTGRAAKVLAAFCGGKAQTIHRTIYRRRTREGEGEPFSLGFNSRRGALFVVDEASMIATGQGGGGALFGSGRLLDDLVQYVGMGTGCRLLLTGDAAQLPPVGELESPALSKAWMEGYGLGVAEAELTKVVRQAAASSALAAATKVRSLLSQSAWDLPRIAGSSRGEVRFVDGSELVEELASAYSQYGEDEVIVITRSNKRANIYNEGIRSRIFDREGDTPTRGDRVMAVKNNYRLTEQNSKQAEDKEQGADFIANGEMAEVLRMRNVHEAHGFRFADATLRFTDREDFEADCRVLLSTLTAESPSLTAEESRRLYESVMEDYAHIPTKRERLKCLSEDPYYTALQIKYAYALTCHKAQGGQWTCVFIDQGFIAPEDAADAAYLRWLYTALTRTTAHLRLVNWRKEQREEVD